MARLISVGLLTLVLATAVGAQAVPRPNPFPLADGNRWILRDPESSVARTMSVEARGQGLMLEGLPGAGALRVRWAGDSVQAWDTANDRWEALFRFGADAGDRYSVRLGDTVLWRHVVVTVASKRAQIEDMSGRTRVGTRFSIASKRLIADAGIESMSFAPGVGPVQFAEETIAGPRELVLAAHRLK
jgi:hypothetical protein